MSRAVFQYDNDGAGKKIECGGSGTDYAEFLENFKGNIM